MTPGELRKLAQRAEWEGHVEFARLCRARAAEHEGAEDAAPGDLILDGLDSKPMQGPRTGPLGSREGVRSRSSV